MLALPAAAALLGTSLGLTARAAVTDHTAIYVMLPVAASGHPRDLGWRDVNSDSNDHREVARR